jgi:hypothetical protein
MRSLLTITAVLAALLALVGCKSEPTPADSLKSDAMPPAAGAPAAGAEGAKIPAGVDAKDVPGVGAPPPAGSPAAMEGGAPAGGSKITQ